MNRAYRDLILARVAGAVTAARAMSSLGHPGLKGQLREIVVRDLLDPLLPPSFGSGTGVIITGRDSQSAEQDIVIFDRAKVPPLLLGNAQGLFPIESVLYTVEVKSKLTIDGLKEAHESAAGTHALQTELFALGTKVVSVPKIGAFLFAFDTDLQPEGKSELDRYREVFSKGQPALHCLCVVGRGCWYLAGEGWEKWHHSHECEEVLGFLGLTMNTWQTYDPRRYQTSPGYYLTGGPSTKGV